MYLKNTLRDITIVDISNPAQPVHRATTLSNISPVIYHYEVKDGLIFTNGVDDIVVIDPWVCTL